MPRFALDWPMSWPSLRVTESSGLAILQAALERIHGGERPGQMAMASAVAGSLESGVHLLVQAGTGTGKSLGYLAPVLARLADDPSERIIIATATRDDEIQTHTDLAEWGDKSRARHRAELRRYQPGQPFGHG